MRAVTILRGLLLALLLSARAAAQDNPLAGTWATVLNPDTPGVIYLTLVFAPNGDMRERMMNRLGITIDLTGTYRFDRGRGLLSFTWTDYAPRQLCIANGPCQSVSPPPFVSFKTPQTSHITFEGGNFMIGTDPNGATLSWTRIS
jgi:hypothetical protein